MSVTTTTHLNFRGAAREALDFYRSVFGGRSVAVTYQDAGAVQDENEADWVMWGEVVGDNGFHVMAYDVPGQLPLARGKNPFFVSVRGEDTGEITALWGRLAQGSTVVRPLEAAQWAPLYGMLTDRFGITWVLDVTVPYNG
ncbi:VOC family protein [Streptacidiphilus sp. N1-12]|uniref:VOC family protein n=2 Tax=Streptacidiphilus alkalitolerans TaxID=3342712 RepID=A0ABV6WRS7_9ACTN